MFGGRKQMTKLLNFNWQRAKALLKLEFDTEDQVLLCLMLPHPVTNVIKFLLGNHPAVWKDYDLAEPSQN